MMTERKSRKTRGARPQICVRIAPETMEGLDRLVAVDHLDKSAHVQLALNEYLDKQLGRQVRQPTSSDD